MRTFVSMSLVLGTLALCMGLVACGGPSNRTVRIEYDKLLDSLKDDGWVASTSPASLKNKGVAEVSLEKSDRAIGKTADGTVWISFYDGSLDSPYADLSITADGRCLRTPETCGEFAPHEIATMRQTLDQFISVRTGFGA